MTTPIPIPLPPSLHGNQRATGNGIPLLPSIPQLPTNTGVINGVPSLPSLPLTNNTAFPPLPHHPSHDLRGLISSTPPLPLLPRVQEKDDTVKQAAHAAASAAIAAAKASPAKQQAFSSLPTTLPHNIQALHGIPAKIGSSGLPLTGHSVSSLPLTLPTGNVMINNNTGASNNAAIAVAAATAAASNPQLAAKRKRDDTVVIPSVLSSSLLVPSSSSVASTNTNAGVAAMAMVAAASSPLPLLPTTAKQYVCQVCDGAFWDNQSLQRHILVHKTKEAGGTGGVTTGLPIPNGPPLLMSHHHHNPYDSYHDKVSHSNSNRRESKKKHYDDDDDYEEEDDEDDAMDDKRVNKRAKKDTKPRPPRIPGVPGERPHICGDCGRTFADIANLKRHAKKHSGNYVCQQCNKGFEGPSHLNRHMRTHSTEKPFTCADCPLRFQTNAALQRHIRTHRETSTVKPLPCPQNCGETFPTKALWDAHLLTHKPKGADGKEAVLLSHQHHINNLPIVDPNAAAVAATTAALAPTNTPAGAAPGTPGGGGAGLLGEWQPGGADSKGKKVVASSGGQKNFACGICGKRYAHQGSLARHGNVHNLTYQCQLCERAVSSKRDLNRHMLLKHGIDAKANPSAVPVPPGTTPGTPAKKHNPANLSIVPFGAGAVLLPGGLTASQAATSSQAAVTGTGTTTPQKPSYNNGVMVGVNNGPAATLQAALAAANAASFGALVGNPMPPPQPMPQPTPPPPVLQAPLPLPPSSSPSALQLPLPLPLPSSSMPIAPLAPLASGPLPLSSTIPIVGSSSQMSSTIAASSSSSTPVPIAAAAAAAVAAAAAAAAASNGVVPGALPTSSDLKDDPNQARQSGNKKKPYECSTCGKHYAHLGSLYRHANVHNGKWECGICGVKTGSKHDLARHTQKHSTVKPFICTVCERGFTRARALTAHKAGQRCVARPHACTHPGCNHRFTTQHNCNTHMRVHTGEKRYVCNFCQSAFTWKQQLNNHKVRCTAGGAQEALAAAAQAAANGIPQPLADDDSDEDADEKMGADDATFAASSPSSLPIGSQQQIAAVHAQAAQRNHMLSILPATSSSSSSTTSSANPLPGPVPSVVPLPTTGSGMPLASSYMNNQVSMAAQSAAVAAAHAVMNGPQLRAPPQPSVSSSQQVASSRSSITAEASASLMAPLPLPTGNVPLPNLPPSTTSSNGNMGMSMNMPANVAGAGALPLLPSLPTLGSGSVASSIGSSSFQSRPILPVGVTPGPNVINTPSGMINIIRPQIPPHVLASGPVAGGHGHGQHAHATQPQPQTLPLSAQLAPSATPHTSLPLSVVAPTPSTLPSTNTSGKI